jgi:hypothetical protein
MMKIETQALTTCEVTADGEVISLGFVDSGGKPATIRLSSNQAGALAMTLPELIDKTPRPVSATRACVMPIRWHPGCASSHPARLML